MVEPAFVTSFPQIDANPYPWPFDGHWSGGDTALLLLGFQAQSIADLDAGPELDTAIGILAVARSLDLCVVASRRGSQGAESRIGRRRAALGDTVHPKGSTAWGLSERLVLPDTAILADHPGDNAFHETGLEDSLRMRGIRNLLIAGLPTEGLVHATQRAANDIGFECLAIADACKGTDAQRHSAQLRITTFGNGLFGAVASAAAIRAALTGN